MRQLTSLIDEPAAATNSERGSRRALGHGDLRLLLLALIESKPRHGYELIRSISELFAGVYTPSAGAVYPTLAQLQRQGWIQSTDSGGRKCYAITDAGRTHAQSQRAALEAALARTHHSARAIARAQVPAPVREAIQRIKRGLFAHHGRWDTAEIERVAALLEQAADAMQAPPGRRPA